MKENFILNGIYSVHEYFQSDILGSLYAGKNKITNELIFIRIFENIYINESVLTNIHEKTKDLHNPRILHFITWDTVKSCDDKRFLNKYFMVYKYFHGRHITYEDLENRTQIEILQLIEKLIRAVVTLNNRKIVYYYFTENDFLVKENEDGKLDIKVLNYGFYTVDMLMECAGNNSSAADTAPEILEHKQLSSAVDIYSIGLLMYKWIFKKHPFLGSDLNETIENVTGGKLNFDSKYMLKNNIPFKLREIISKALTHNPKHRYRMITNISMHLIKEFQIIDTKKESSKIHKLTEPEFTNRKSEIRFLKKNYDDIFYKKKLKFILLYGESGIGKTSIVKTFAREQRLTGSNVFQCKCSRETTAKSSVVVNFIRNQFISRKEKEKFNEKFYKLFVTGGHSKNELTSLSSNLMSFLYSYIKRFISITGSVWIIENLEFIDELTANFLIYLKTNYSKIKLLVITTLNVPERVSHIGLIDNFLIPRLLYHEFHNTDFYDELKISYLKKEEVAELIASILNYDYSPVVFSEMLLKKVRGNPKLIINLFKFWYQKQLLLFRDSVWIVEVDNFDDLPIPAFINQRYADVWSEIDENCREILFLISVYNAPSPMELITDLIPKPDLENSVNYLLNHNILKISEGDNFFFEDNGFRYFVYKKIDSAKRKRLHWLCAKFIEQKSDYFSNLSDVESLVEHYKHLNNISKLIYYCIQAAELNAEEYSYQKSKLYYEKAFELFENETLDKKQAEKFILISYNLLDILWTLEDVDEIDKLCSKILDIIEKTDIEDLDLSYIYFNIGKLHRFRNPQQSIDFLDTAEKYALMHNNGRNLLEIYSLKAVIYAERKRFDEGEACVAYIEKNFDKFDNPNLRVKSMNSLGVFYLLQNRYSEKAFNIFTEIINYYEENIDRIHDLKLISFVYNNIGISYMHKSDFEMAILHYEKSKLLKSKLNLNISISKTYNNLALCYTYIGNYRQGIYNIIKAIEEASVFEGKYTNLIIKYYIFFINIHVKLGNFSKALMIKKKVFDLSAGKFKLAMERLADIFAYSFIIIDDDEIENIKFLIKENEIDDKEVKIRENLLLWIDALNECYRYNDWSNFKNIKKTMDSFRNSSYRDLYFISYVFEALYELLAKKRIHKAKISKLIENLEEELKYNNLQFRLKILLNTVKSTISDEPLKYLQIAEKISYEKMDYVLLSFVYFMKTKYYLKKKNYEKAFIFLKKNFALYKKIFDNLPSDYRHKYKAFFPLMLIKEYMNKISIHLIENNSTK